MKTLRHPESLNRGDRVDGWTVVKPLGSGAVAIGVHGSWHWPDMERGWLYIILGYEKGLTLAQ